MNSRLVLTVPSIGTSGTVSHYISETRGYYLRINSRKSPKFHLLKYYTNTTPIFISPIEDQFNEIEKLSKLLSIRCAQLVQEFPTSETRAMPMLTNEKYTPIQHYTTLLRSPEITFEKHLKKNYLPKYSENLSFIQVSNVYDVINK